MKNVTRLVIPKLAFFTLTFRLRKLRCSESDTSSSFWWKLQFSEGDLRMNILGIILKYRRRWRPHKIVPHSVLQAVLFRTPGPCCGSKVLTDSKISHEYRMKYRRRWRLHKIIPHSVLQAILFSYTRAVLWKQIAHRHRTNIVWSTGDIEGHIK